MFLGSTRMYVYKIIITRKLLLSFSILYFKAHLKNDDSLLVARNNV
jgi:hypothetical protein